MTPAQRELLEADAAMFERDAEKTANTARDAECEGRERLAAGSWDASERYQAKADALRAALAQGAELARLRTALEDVAGRLDTMIRYRHSEAHNGDVYVGGRYEQCPLCEETREAIANAAALTPSEVR